MVSCQAETIGRNQIGGTETVVLKIQWRARYRPSTRVPWENEHRTRALTSTVHSTIIYVYIGSIETLYNTWLNGSRNWTPLREIAKTMLVVRFPASSAFFFLSFWMDRLVDSVPRTCLTNVEPKYWAKNKWKLVKNSPFDPLNNWKWNDHSPEPRNRRPVVEDFGVCVATGWQLFWRCRWPTR